MVISIYQPVNEDQIEEIDVRAKNALPRACPKYVARYPDHVYPLLEQARPVCKSEDQCTRLAGLLIVYPDVFNQGESDVERTDVIKHFIYL